MSHDEWRNAATGRAVVAMDVTPANATGTNLDQDFAGCGFGYREIDDLQNSII
jgi:hypothetical protein